jgi:hypothetical protein
MDPDRKASAATRGPRRAGGLAALAIAQLCACSALPGSRPADVVSVPLAPSRINVGETGIATLVSLGERTQVTVIVSGVPPQIASRPVHLYTFIDEGRCSDASKPAFALTERVLAQSGASPSAGPFTITNVAPVSVDVLRLGTYAIRVTTAPSDGGRDVFCGEITGGERRP